MSNRSVFAPKRGLLYGYLTPLLTIGLFVVLIGLSVVSMWYRSQNDIGYLIADEIATLATIFKRIEESCKIINFDHQKNPINFLNIKKGGFVGSELGSMNLAHPEQWDGPYLVENPKIEGCEYQIVHTKNGYFITPGQGVKLPNGKIIGKDIMLDEHADIMAMMQDEQQLRFCDRPLAAPIYMRRFSLPDTTPHGTTHAIDPEDLVDEL